MAEKQNRREQISDGYQAKYDKPINNPPTGSSNIKPPPSARKEESNK